MLDIKIAGGQIIDGTGAAAARADLGITGDTITAIGDLEREPAGRTIDAAGLTVAPGFIDMHTHSDWRLWANRRAESKIRQGVTTEAVGNCGFSPAPVSDEFRAEMRSFALYTPPGMDFSWQSMRDYLRRYRDDGVAVNVVHLVGHGHAAPGGDGLRAPASDGARADHDGTSHGRLHGERRLRARHRPNLRAGLVRRHVGFDATRVEDLATYEAPHQYAAGIPYVLVNGRVVIDGSAHTGALPGQVLTPADRKRS